MMILLVPALAGVLYALSRESAPTAARRVGGTTEYNTPLAALSAALRAGQPPSSDLVQWAIAEAQALGRNDVAGALYQRFIAPLLQPGSPSSAPAMPAFAGAPPTPASQAPSPVPTATSGEISVAPPPSPASPIAGVSDDAWCALARELAVSEPSYASQKRVGRYHQSKTRLAELGFEADSLIGNAHAQDAALAADLSEGITRARDRGLLDAIGASVTVPGCDAAQPVTLSGVLGILSIGGVQGLAGWLGSEIDRQRFPHTTNTFLRTNGMF